MQHFECGCILSYSEDGHLLGGEQFCGVINGGIHQVAEAGFTNEAYYVLVRKMNKHFALIRELANH